jgi:uncharacterized protein with ATP-grasp and redox domains
MLDRLLIETMKEWRMDDGGRNELEIVFVVRSLPTLNDATLKEARMVGVDRIASVLENGIDGPLPGTITSRCSGEVRDLLQRADLILSKGGKFRYFGGGEVFRQKHNILASIKVCSLL